MKCSYCGKEIPEQWAFCMHCGTKVVQAPVAPVAPAVPVAPVAPVAPMEAEETVLETPQFNVPAFDESEFVDPRFVEPKFAEPQFDETKLNLAREYEPDLEMTIAERPIAEHSQERKVSIDPEKFEFHPEVREEPVPRGVSSWELVPAENVAPRITLPTRRGLAKMFFLGMITLGIYPLVIYSKIITELNIVASRYDGRRTMPFLGMVVLSPLTLYIYPYVWFHNVCERIGNELQRRGIDYKFGPAHFWLWNLLGSLILVGPFIFLHKLMKSMNLLNADFNAKG